MERIAQHILSRGPNQQYILRPLTTNHSIHLMLVKPSQESLFVIMTLSNNLIDFWFNIDSFNSPMFVITTLSNNLISAFVGIHVYFFLPLKVDLM